MRNSKAKLYAIRLLMLAALVIMLGAVLNASSCRGGEFHQTLGSKLDADANIARTTSGHKYVADRDTKLYWPNKPKYLNKIPKGSRVWILNDTSLTKYKSFKPGPL